jgi:sugar lactone lactonase YvrE
MNPEVRCVTDVVDEIGEGPMWSAREQSLCWVDAGPDARRLMRWQARTGTTDIWQLALRAPNVNERAAGGLLVGLQRGLATAEHWGAPLVDLPLLGVDFEVERINDSGVDAAGRLWLGTFDRRLKAPLGALYRIDGALSAARVDQGFMMSNGIAFSPDARTMYFNDSRPGRIHAYDYDVASGEASRHRILMDFAGRQGRPDGCAMDAEGFLWVAEIDAGQLLRLAPDGRIARTVPLPVSRPTSLAFGGDDLRTIFVTSMTFGLDATQRERQPWAGRLLAFDAGVAGLPRPPVTF